MKEVIGKIIGVTIVAISMTFVVLVILFSAFLLAMTWTQTPYPWM